MLTAIGIALPFFAVILCGYLAGRFRVLPDGGIAGVNAFVYWFALPAMLFLTMATTPFARLVDAQFFMAYLLAGFVVLAVALASARILFRLEPGALALQSFACIFNNTGYMGLPLIVAAMGPETAAPVILTLTIDNTVMIAVVVAMLERSRGAGKAHEALRVTAAGLARNPLILAIAAGMLVSALEMPLPGPGESFLRLLGGAAGPSALFALGASLASRGAGEKPGEIAHMVALKLFAHPAAVWLAMTLIFAVDPLWAVAATLSAAMPIGGTAFVLAERYKTSIMRVSAAVLVSTALSVVSVSALLALLSA